MPKIVRYNEKFSIYPQCTDRFCEDIIYDNCNEDRDEIKVRKGTNVLYQPNIVDLIISDLNDETVRTSNILYLKNAVEKKYKDCSLIKLQLSDICYVIVIKQSCLDYSSRIRCA